MNSADLAGAIWRKSSRSNGDANCLEVAFLSDGRVAMRDSKHNGSGPTLVFASSGWTAFEGGVADGGFRRP
ncbi:DUF397 domain-containing protein [Streptomyces sp. NBC_01754]|uniref:DUF397 domain-containing protein n=1 Tax=Streptomyces sp. NBC_01754 TaxID=2975930 RepID=UPI002DDB9C41|nr:DUF397 domain-containing protein [Streptomyces sp. NBC_01754]WSC94875.1 DUF397 domain-containing protein [Streptomyces sp. NBC_01754]